jgi:hypothetical protein
MRKILPAACTRADSGYAAAAPPSSDMKSRRLMGTSSVRGSFLQSLPESRQPALKLSIGLGAEHENAEPPYSFLRPSRQGPSYYAAEQRDELACRCRDGAPTEHQIRRD